MKYSIKCQTIPQKSKDKNSPIRMRVSYSGIRVDLRLGLSVPPNCWDSKKEEAHTRQAEYKQLCAEINTRLHEVTARIDQLFARCEFVDKRPPTINEIKSIVDNRICGSRLRDVFESYLRENKHLEQNTILSYKNSLNSILSVTGDIYINEFNARVITETIDTLTERYRNSTLRTIVNRIITILRFAQERGIYTANGLTYKFKYHLLRKVIVHLELDELKAFEGYTPGSKAEIDVYDTFLFCCYTGLRISDAYALTWDNVKDDKIDVVTIKTGEHLSIELNSHSAAVLKRRRERESTEDTIFHNYDVAYYNDTLREICRKVGINAPVTNNYFQGNERISHTAPKWEFVSSHTGRKTFVVTAVTLGLAVPIIMEWTGHKTLKSIDPYLKVVDTLKQRSMSRFDEI